MPPRLNIWSASRALSVRSRPLVQCQPPRMAALARGYADNATLPPNPPPQDANSSIPPAGRSADGSLSEASTSEGITEVASSQNEVALGQLELVAHGLNPFDENFAGHKFGIPEFLPASQINHKNRYDPAIKQITNLLMRDGKLSKAQRDMAMILNYLRTSPPPKISPSRPLLPGSPPPAQLPLNPTVYLTLAVDSVAPLIRIRYFAGLAGGGAALPIPTPMALRQRRRVAWMWLMDVVNKKPSKGSGRTMLAHRIGEEIVAVVEGRSSIWEKRQQVHKQGTTARANLTSPALVKHKRAI